MAAGNMMVTLTAQTSQFQKGMRQSSDSVNKFGKMASTAGKVGLLAIVTAIAAVVNFVPDLIRMGEESRKADLKLASLAETSGLFGKQTAAVTDRMKEFANATMLKTGVDDELIKSAQGILLTFKKVGDSADEVGGVFDRATQAAIDLAAAGFGNIESNAKALGKALQDPSKGLTALTKAGVTFTDAEKKRIRTLQESNRLNEAQLLIMSAIEGQVGGTAAATVSATDLMKVRFEDMGERLGEALLPAIDAVAVAMTEWLDDPQNKAMLDGLVTSIQEFAAWMNSPEGKQAMKDFFDEVTDSAKVMYDKFVQFTDWIKSDEGQATIKGLGTALKIVADIAQGLATAITNISTALNGVDYSKLSATTGGSPALNFVGSNVTYNPNDNPMTPIIERSANKGIVVNFNAPVDSVSAGREVQRVLNDYARANGGIR